jgi:tetratricopeptide (TPR) repeat protein
LKNIGEVYRYLGDYVRAKAYYEESLDIDRKFGSPMGECHSLNFCGVTAAMQGDYGKARAYHEQALHICRKNDYRHIEGKILTDLGNALLGLGQPAEAATTFQQAVALRQELEQPPLVVESQAGLARVALAQGNLAEAHSHIEMILDYLKTKTLDGTEEPLQIYLTCYRVLQATQDDRARDILNLAYALLQEQAAKVSDEAVRRSFLENVTEHRQIAVEWQQLHG